MQLQVKLELIHHLRVRNSYYVHTYTTYDFCFCAIFSFKLIQFLKITKILI